MSRDDTRTTAHPAGRAVPNLSKGHPQLGVGLTCDERESVRLSPRAEWPILHIAAHKKKRAADHQIIGCVQDLVRPDII